MSDEREDRGCHCGYVFPRVELRIATETPSEYVVIIMQCPECSCSFEHALTLKGRVPGAELAAHLAPTNARGGSA